MIGDQRSLFELGYRESDPETSKDAAESMVETAANHRQQILNFLGGHGPATGDAIDEALGWKHATANRRLPELRAQGRVVMTTETAPTRSGRQARIWELR